MHPGYERTCAMRLFDAHCHLQDERLASTVDGVLARAAAAGVRAMSCCGSAPADWAAVASLAQRDPAIVPSYGLHPWYVGERTADWLAQLAGYLRTPGTSVGEIGLDHAIEDADRALQEEAFRVQVELAIDLRRPVTLHCRKAWGRMMELLPRWADRLPGLVIHSYSGASELIVPLARHGVYFSFSGSITYPRSQRGRLALAAVPLDRLLIETDAPDIMPDIDTHACGHTADGRPLNEPANLVHVLRTVAALRGQTEAAMARVTWDNACRLFGVAGTE